MVFSAFEKLVSWRYLRARKSEGFVSVIAGFSFLGIMLGVATLIIVMSVMNGFRAELVSRILGLNGHLNVYAIQGAMYDYDTIRDRIHAMKDIESVRPMVEGQVLLSTKKSASGVVVRGFAPEDFASKPIISDSIIEGDLNNFSGNVIAIGTEMARRLGLVLGDEVVLLAPKGKVSPFGTVPRSRRYTVAILFDVGMYEYNNGFLFMPLKSAQEFFSLKDAVNSLEVITSSPLSIEGVKNALQTRFGGVLRFYDWRDANKSFLNALAVERNVMFLILTLIILVAAFNIISSMVMLVKDKYRDIAILRTMGASRGSIMRIFIRCGASIGFLGTCMGTVLGIAFALNIETIRQFLEGLTGTELFADEIYFLSQLPAVVDWQEVISIVLMSLVLSIVATLYPAWKAARLDPVEAIRYE